MNSTILDFSDFLLIFYKINFCRHFRFWSIFTSIYWSQSPQEGVAPAGRDSVGSLLESERAVKLDFLLEFWNFRILEYLGRFKFS